MLHFNLPKEMVEVIARALGAGQFSVVAPVINEMQRQINEQEAEAAAARAAASKKED